MALPLGIKIAILISLAMGLFFVLISSNDSSGRSMFEKLLDYKKIEDENNKNDKVNLDDLID